MRSRYLRNSAMTLRMERSSTRSPNCFDHLCSHRSGVRARIFDENLGAGHSGVGFLSAQW